jgi:hypothetical protein
MVEIWVFGVHEMKAVTHLYYPDQKNRTPLWFLFKFRLKEVMIFHELGR